MTRVESTRDLIRQILRDDYLAPVVEAYSVSESVADGAPCRIEVRLHHEGQSQSATIEGEGVGFVDAVCQGRNSEGNLFEFERQGRSLVATAVLVVVEALEHFVNSERAFISVYKALQDARERGRSDLVQTYTAQLTELVRTTSYTQVIERIKAETLR